MRYGRVMRIPALFLCLVLAACATPREACLTSAVRDLVAIDRLIAEIESNLARGYAIKRVPVTTTGFEFCVGGATGGKGRVGLRYCSTTETKYKDEPEAIDPRAERRKLAELKSSRARLAARAAEAQSSCRAKYPET